MGCVPRHRPLWSAVLLLLSCASPQAPHTPGAGTGASPAAATDAHPLLERGRLWDVRRDRELDVRTLLRELTGARYVLLGEQHDNPHHHALQAAVVRALVKAGRRPVLALEMLDASQQELVDAALAHSPEDPDALARAVDWVRSGWPDWALYRPIVAAALEAGLPIVAANLSREQAKRLVREGPDALPPEQRARLGLDTPLPTRVERELRDELRDSHCGQLPEALLGGMVLAQRARDAFMAQRLVETDRGDGAILITGAGHARVDRGVPAHLARLAPGRRVRSVGFLEAPAGSTEPTPATAQPFDYVWLTPGVERGDPCAALRGRGG